MNRANVSQVTLDWVVAPCSIGLKATSMEQTTNKQRRPTLLGGTKSDRQLLGKILKRWGQQLIDDVPITADLTADGKGFE